MAPEPGRTYTADEYLGLRGWEDYELVDGELVPFHCGALASSVCVAVAAELNRWCRPRRFGWVFSSGATYRCFPGRPNLVRRPWVSLVRAERLPREMIPSVGHLAVAPDLVGDVMTPWHTYEEVEAKVAEYRSAGVRLVWVISPKTKTVLVRRLDGTCTEVAEAGELSGEDVVPGFACQVAGLFV
jgi:Uma2 family endonuclease